MKAILLPLSLTLTSSITAADKPLSAEKRLDNMERAIVTLILNPSDPTGSNEDTVSTEKDVGYLTDDVRRLESDIFMMRSQIADLNFELNKLKKQRK